jgi:hypothetical protein
MRGVWTSEVGCKSRISYTNLKHRIMYGDFQNRNFEKSHRTTDPRWDLRPDSWSWANSGLDTTSTRTFPLFLDHFWLYVRSRLRPNPKGSPVHLYVSPRCGDLVRVQGYLSSSRFWERSSEKRSEKVCMQDHHTNLRNRMVVLRNREPVY